MDDQGLIRRLQRGEADALRTIYGTYKDYLLTLATCLLPDRALAEDVVHDVFVALAGHARHIRLPASLKAYLATSIANRARDELRRKVRRPIMTAVSEQSASPARGPLETAIDGEQADNLRLAFAELPYEQREVILLHLQVGLTFKELAIQQAVSINTVQSRYRYGIDKLRSLLNAGAPV